MDITLIALAIFLLVAIAILILFLFKNINKKSFKAEDGSTFDNKLDLEVYQKLLEKTLVLFKNDEESISAQALLGFRKSFIAKLTKEGFPDLKTLVQYRKQIKSLSDLINS